MRYCYAPFCDLGVARIVFILNPSLFNSLSPFLLKFIALSCKMPKSPSPHHTSDPAPTATSTPSYARRAPPSITITATAGAANMNATDRVPSAAFPSSPTATAEGQGVPLGDTFTGASVVVSSSSSGRHFRIDTPQDPTGNSTHRVRFPRNSGLGTPDSGDRPSPYSHRSASELARQRYQEDIQDILTVSACSRVCPVLRYLIHWLSRRF